MATYTSRLNATKPASSENVDIAILDANFDLFDLGVGATVGASSTLPASAFSGRLWYETDTTRFKVNTAANASTAATWATINSSISGSGGTGAGFYLFTGDPTGATSVNTALTNDAAAAVAAGYPLLIPDGDFQITSGLSTLPAGLRMIGTRNARFFRSSTGNMLTLSSNTIVDGITLECAGSGSAAIKIAASSSNIEVTRCKIMGASGAQVFYIDATGISDVRVLRNEFSTGSYGFLVNSTDRTTGAYDLTNVQIIGNKFDSFTADPINFNHPSSLAPTCGHYTIHNNYNSNPLGSSTSAGFFIALAGVDGASIKGNKGYARREFVHVEDASRKILIGFNECTSVTGTGSRGGIVIYAGCEYIHIDNNILEGVSGIGIECVYDASTVLSGKLKITNNTVIAPTSKGITAGCETLNTDYLIVQNNLVLNAGGDSFEILGNPDVAVVTGNVGIGSTGGYGYSDESNGGSTARLRILRNNTFINNASGDYQGRAISSGTATPVRERHAQGTTAASNGSSIATANLFRLGRHADGFMHLTSRRPGGASTNRGDSMWRIKWNGTNLYYKRLVHTTNGTMTHGPAPSASAGILTMPFTVSASGLTVEYAAEFVGLCHEENANVVSVAGTEIAVTGSRSASTAAVLGTLLAFGASAGYWTDSTTA